MTWRVRLRQVFDKAIDFVLPPVCVSCGRIGAVFCDSCQRTLAWFSGPLCSSCGRQLTRAGALCLSCDRQTAPLAELRVVCTFSGAARDAVHALKYDGMFSVAMPVAALMARHFPAWSAPCDLIIPVPLHPERVRERGYNQSALLARHLCEHVHIPYDEEALWRTRHTRPQVGLDRAQRRQNVQGAFAAERLLIAGKQVLLIDDVCTSGATLEAAAAALLEAGASAVRGFCFARPAAS